MEFALFVFGGIIPAFLNADPRSVRVRCGACRQIFRQPVPRRKAVSLLAFSVFWAAIIFVLAGVFLTILPGAIPDLSKNSIVEGLASFVEANRRLGVVPKLEALWY